MVTQLVAYRLVLSPIESVVITLLLFILPIVVGIMVIILTNVLSNKFTYGKL
jgi:hypothetical protein